MSLWCGLWEVLSVDPAGKWVCRCVCGAIVMADLATLNESSTCSSCGHRPLAPEPQQRTNAQQLDFEWAAHRTSIKAIHHRDARRRIGKLSSVGTEQLK